MSLNLMVELVTTDRTVWSGHARAITAPSSEGSVGILPGHQPLLAVLRPGKVEVTGPDDKKLEFEVSGGFVSVDHDTVTIVVDPTVDADVSDD